MNVPRSGSGEAKGRILESVRGVDLFILVDVCNYSITYKVCGWKIICRRTITIRI